ncbi:hypothetical protein [Sphingomonas nostoxanthinifaciens]|uniref:hypothetical protein n=1 Tax=Sphingomonas nostoxanthinifaciens TaxID=2872652 RepID=UPI001CC1CFCD|nr:hypothetical protein [Sphingomonas nostoxanthinifaciens]UAK24348.1 hypothetical protein K8P63_18880 [Sphingomonas nostoxanthinifaciens]
MADPTIRPANVAVLFNLETNEAVDAGPDPTVDGIPVESDSVTYNSPWTTEAANEATGSLVGGAPLIIGQSATFSFKSRVKGAGGGVVYTSTVKPPLHQVLQACGWRGQFTPAIMAALATAGGATSVTLPASFPATARALLGSILLIGAGTGNGAAAAIVEYTAGRVATLAETYNPPLDTTTSASIPANWTYAQTSPSDQTARLTDQPSGTCYIYEDGVLRRFVGCRGTIMLDGKNARPGYATVNMTGIYAGRADTPVPTNLVVAGHSAPVLAQGTAVSNAMLMNRRPLPISTWSLDPGSQIENVDDPNTTYGFGAGQIVDRTSILKIDPLATLIASRDTITDIGNGVTYPAVLRHGAQPGNRWALIVPVGQPTAADPGTRGKLRSEQISLQCRNNGRDAVTRDTDRILCFY